MNVSEKKIKKIKVTKITIDKLDKNVKDRLVSMREVLNELYDIFGDFSIADTAEERAVAMTKAFYEKQRHARISMMMKVNFDVLHDLSIINLTEIVELNQQERFSKIVKDYMEGMGIFEYRFYNMTEVMCHGSLVAIRYMERDKAKKARERKKKRALRKVA